MKHPVTILLVTCALLAASIPARANIVNGDFESGWSGWTRASQPGSDGGFHLQTGTTSPVNGLAVPAAPGGAYAAMTDAAGPGSHVLYQDFITHARVGSAMLSFEVYVNNTADDFFNAAMLDFGTPELNQQGRVDLLLGGSDDFTLAPGAVLLNLHQTVAGTPAATGYTRVDVDVTALVNAHLGEALRLRVAEVDNVSMLLYGIDNISLAETPVPEPNSLRLLLAGGGLLAARRWQGRAVQRSRSCRR